MSVPEPTPVEAAEENEENGDEVAGGDPKKKKKKKKGAKKDEEVVAPPATTGAASKKKGGLNALKAFMEEKKRLEDEAKRKEEEERRRIEEEERRAEEEERKKEEEKQRRKEKEKVRSDVYQFAVFLTLLSTQTNFLLTSIQAKRELAKKEGRLLTKKQKEEKQMAELRKQALLASGVQIEGLQHAPGSGPPAGKKVVYSNQRKKKGPAAKDGSSAPDSRPRTPEPSFETPSPAPSVHAELAEEKVENEDAKSDWEANTEEEGVKSQIPTSVKDSWDDSSEEEDVGELRNKYSYSIALIFILQHRLNPSLKHPNRHRQQLQQARRRLQLRRVQLLSLQLQVKHRLLNLHRPSLKWKLPIQRTNLIRLTNLVQMIHQKRNPTKK